VFLMTHGQCEVALEFSKRALGISERYLGSEHPHTQIARTTCQRLELARGAISSPEQPASLSL